MIGKTTLHYKIIKKLGQDGMGVVYLAEDKRLVRKVATKLLPPRIARNSEEKERFIIETKAAAALNYPKIDTIHVIKESDNQFFISREYIEESQVLKIINTNPASWSLTKGGLKGGVIID
jgi:serine/threonine protein kinase